VDPTATKEEMLDSVSSKMGLVFAIHWGSMGFGMARSTILGVAAERVVARLRTRLYVVAKRARREGVLSRKRGADLRCWKRVAEVWSGGTPPQPPPPELPPALARR
jgi:hypothetical protein